VLDRDERESQVEIALLGPVEIRVGGELVAVDRLQRRLLVSVLAPSANTTVATDRIIRCLMG
jgi:DNA-binding SARP family transcriptional activator